MAFDTLDEGALRGELDMIYKVAAQDIEKATDIEGILDALDGSNRLTNTFLDKLRQSGEKFKAEAEKIESNIRALGELNSWLRQPYAPKSVEVFDPKNPVGFLIPEQIRKYLNSITQTWVPGLRDKVRDILLQKFGGNIASSLIGTLRGDAAAGHTLQLTITGVRKRAYEGQNEYDRYMGIIHASNSFKDLNVVLKALVGAEAPQKPATDLNMQKIVQAQQFVEQLAKWEDGEPHSAAKILSDIGYISNTALPGLRDKVLELLVVEIGGDQVARVLHGAGGRETATRLG